MTMSYNEINRRRLLRSDVWVKQNTMRRMICNVICSLTVVAMCAAAGAVSAADLVLADGGQSAYQIVVADGASPSTKHGAEELQMFLEQMTAAKLPIVSDQQSLGPKEIILGDNAHLRNLGVTVDFAALGKEGYVIRTVGDHLVIAGGPVRGAMYGVYGLLEDHLGCRWFAPEVSRVPKCARLTVGPIDDRQVPVLEYREPYVCECLDGDWCARNRMNSSGGRLDEKHGGKVRFGDGFFCHTFATLVPPEKYFEEHPEYFSLVNGQRQKKDAQLCCTNPDVIHICTETIRRAMRDQPQATVFSVSQNDCDRHCRCPRCHALERQEDSPMAPVLQLVNHVAEAVEKEFPDKIVETLAYQWTRRAPKYMRPRPNVVVRLCSIECCFSHSLATCSSVSNETFRTDIERWAKVAPRLWAWDYTTDFDQYLLPFPNQRVIGPNIRFYVEHNVKGIFEEDTTDTPDGELSTLGGYVMAKCLWNPNYDSKKAMNEFLEGYYGKAATPIHAYIDLIHDYVERKHIHVRIFTNCDSPHLTDDLLTKANQHWQEAENCVAGEPEVLRRVKLSRMSPDYAIVERARLQMQQKLPVDKAYLTLAAARFKPFIETLRSSRVGRLRESAPFDKEAYVRDLAKDLRLNVP